MSTMVTAHKIAKVAKSHRVSLDYALKFGAASFLFHSLQRSNRLKMNKATVRQHDGLSLKKNRLIHYNIQRGITQRRVPLLFVSDSKL